MRSYAVILCLSMICIACSTLPYTATGSSSLRNGEHDEKVILWTENSTHHLEDRFVVERGQTLIIEPGVKVFFGYDGPGCLNPKELNIEGKMIARGTEENRILFTSNESVPEAGDWGKITFSRDADPGSIVEYSIIEYCNTGIHLNELDISIRNNIMRNVHRFGVKCQASSPLIENNTISTLDTGIRVMDCMKVGASHPIIRNNTLENNLHYGIYMDAHSEPLIENNLLRNNSEYGVYSMISSPILVGNVFENCKDGISLYESGGRIVGNSIVDCTDSGIYIDYCENVTIAENNLSGNSIGVYCNNSKCTITDNSFTGGGPASMEIVESDVELARNERSGSIEYFEYLTINVVNTDGYPLLGTNFTINNKEGKVYEGSLKNRSKITRRFKSASLNSSGTMETLTPYRIVLEKDGISTDNIISNLNDGSHVAKIDLSGKPMITIGRPEPMMRGEGLEVSGVLSWGDIDTDRIDYRIMISIDGGEWENATGRTRWVHVIDISGLDAGEHSMEVKVADGIASPSAAGTFNVMKEKDRSILILSLFVVFLPFYIFILDRYKSRKS